MVGDSVSAGNDGLDDGHTIVGGHLPSEFGVGCGLLIKGGQASEPAVHGKEFS